MNYKQSNRKILLITFIVAILVLPLVPVGAKKTPIPSSITVERISSKITRFEEKIPLDIPGLTPPDAYYRASVYAVKVEGGIVLIDSGDEALAEDLYEAVTGTLSQPIVAIYLTHYHADHAGGGSYFQSMDIPVYSPMAEAWAIQLGANVQSGIPDAFTYPEYTPDEFYENIELERGFEIKPASGHTFGAVHIKFTKGNKNYLFTADTILPMASEDQSPLDFTSNLSIQTAHQNYGYKDAGPIDLWTTQLNTLYGMMSDIGSYEMVLTGHTPILDSENSIWYLGYTISILESFAP